MDLKSYAQSFHVANERPDIDRERLAKKVLAKIRKRGTPVVLPSPKKGYIYYASDGHGRIKIGHSQNPWSRVSEMRCWNPDVKVVATEKCDDYFALERQRHEQFKSDHLALEWFRESEALLSHINEIKKGGDAKCNTTSTVDAGHVVKQPPQEGEAALTVRSSGAAQFETKRVGEFRMLVMPEKAKDEPTMPATKPLIFRDDNGRVITERAWNALQKLKEKAKEGEYHVDDYIQ